MSTKDGIKLSLGGDIYLTHTFFKNVDRIHIRKYITMPSLFNVNSTFQTPTKEGVSLKIEQARRLESLLPCIVKELQSGNPQEVVPQPLGDEMCLSFEKWNGQFKTHIRKWTPLRNINPNTDTPDKLQSTKNGITLNAGQVCKLSEQFPKMFELLQPTFTQPYHPDMLRQQPSTSNNVTFDHNPFNYFGSEMDNTIPSQSSMVSETFTNNPTQPLNIDSIINDETGFDTDGFWDSITLSQSQTTPFKPPPTPKKRGPKGPRRRYSKRAQLYPPIEKTELKENIPSAIVDSNPQTLPPNSDGTAASYGGDYTPFRFEVDVEGI